MRNNTTHRRRGFTLVEMLVATSLFSVIVIASTDIFIRSQRMTRTASSIEKVQDITRFLMTRMVQEIQSSRIDYDYYTRLTADKQPESTDARIISRTLALKNSEGQDILFTTRPNAGGTDKTDFGSICVDPASPCLIFATTSPTQQSERATPDGYSVKSLRFLITPGKNPYAQDGSFDFTADAQPKVTIIMSVHGTLANNSNPIDLTVQTTVSPREYPR